MSSETSEALESYPTTISVTVDKSHIIAIGERLYTESIELIRELVNNAYDADATRVDVGIGGEEITIRDNGIGMDLKGLRQYFNIGSEEKKKRPKSPMFHRDRIGQFGIGKFASLTACRRFEIHTQKGDFHARVVFDRDDWGKSSHNWEIPLQVLPSDSIGGAGTTVRLGNLFRSFELEEIRKRLMESVPLKAPHFDVFLNGQKVQPRYYAGHKIGVMEGTRFGSIWGEIVVLPASQVTDEDYGIEIKVKQVTVCRETFGLEESRELLERVRGEIHADFLPVTSDRTGFVRDSDDYQAFAEVMAKVTAEVKHVFQKLSSRHEKRRASRALNEAIERITLALNMNPELSPFGMLPSNPTGTKEATEKSAAGMKEEKPKKPRQRRKGIKQIAPDAVIKRFRVGSSKIACCLDHLGAEGLECQSELGIIYINRDHPLYVRSMRSPQTYMWHIGRLLTQEITLMANPTTARQAFLRQSRLLKDAYSELVPDTDSTHHEINS